MINNVHSPRDTIILEVLRDLSQPVIKTCWDKDRGKYVESAPWFHPDNRDMINDRHLSLKERQG